MSIGRFIKFIFYFALFVFVIGSLTGYYIGILPLSVGLHSKYYKSSNVGLEGYDLTIYHTKKKANLGDVRFNYKYAETNWFFTSSQHQKSFKSKPNKYLPKFGGYCTYTISKGYTYPPDPKVWYLKNGKLYFFKDEETKKKALSDWKNILENANKYWQ